MPVNTDQSTRGPAGLPSPAGHGCVAMSSQEHLSPAVVCDWPQPGSRAHGTQARWVLGGWEPVRSVSSLHL